MGARRIRKDQRQVDMALSRLLNGEIKVKERARRDARMLLALKKGTLPYTPVIMSWLSVKTTSPAVSSPRRTWTRSWPVRRRPDIHFPSAPRFFHIASACASCS